jgi:hypothetical protein
MYKFAQNFAVHKLDIRIFTEPHELVITVVVQYRHSSENEYHCDRFSILIDISAKKFK